MRLRLIAVTMGICLWSVPAHASPVTWYLDALFTDGSTAIGSFVYDLDGGGPFGSYADAMIEVTSAVDGSRFDYTGPGDARLNFHEVTFFGLDRHLTLFVDALAGRTESALDTDFSIESGVAATTSGRFVAGHVTTTAPIATPEPTTLLLTTLGGLLLMWRQRHQLDRKGCG